MEDKGLKARVYVDATIMGYPNSSEDRNNYIRKSIILCEQLRKEGILIYEEETLNAAKKRVESNRWLLTVD